MSQAKIPLESQLRYLRRRQDELARLQQSWLGTPDWELCKKMGHQIKGNAITFGFPQLTELGKKLEEFALNTDLPRAQVVAKDLEDEVGTLLASLGRFAHQDTVAE